MPDTLLSTLLKKAETIGPQPLPDVTLGMMPMPSGGYLGRMISHPSPSASSAVEDLFDLGVSKALGVLKDKAVEKFHAAFPGQRVSHVPADVLKYLVEKVPVSPDAPRVQ